jgi:hypothetical protein
MLFNRNMESTLHEEDIEWLKISADSKNEIVKSGKHNNLFYFQRNDKIKI